jgi:alpha-amylase
MTTNIRTRRAGAPVLLAAAALILISACQPGQNVAPAPATNPAAFWNSATVYFLLTDRFHNGDPANDGALGRMKDGGLFRNFEGGDLAGVRQKLDDGYFDSLGVDAIWLTPFVEQVHGFVDEGTGKTYGYHGYWTRDWTAVDPAMGTEEELRGLVDAAHRRGIRVIMDAVLNHPGPVTQQDPAWPGDWVRTTPQCTYKDYVTTVTCTLVPTLPDVLTEKNDPVDLPPALLDKWQREGRRDREVAELDAFFRRTGYPRAPRFYLIKWLTDWVRDMGFDGYRFDTAKHVEESVSLELKHEAERAFSDWKRANPAKVLDDLPFYMVGEVYGWGVGPDRGYNFGDRTVDFFAHGYDALINFGFKQEAAGSPDSLFSKYSSALGAGPLRGVAVLHYLSSHDDGQPFDRDRRNPVRAGNLLLLAPGGAQIYYGDEIARPLVVPGAEGDAHLRSPMNWADLERNATRQVLEHWRKLGRFRQGHRAVGAGEHRRLQAAPYIFSRVLGEDRVIVALDQPVGEKAIPVFGVFPDGASVVDEYSGVTGMVEGGSVDLSTPFTLVLLGRR